MKLKLKLKLSGGNGYRMERFRVTGHIFAETFLFFFSIMLVFVASFQKTSIFFVFVATCLEEA